MDIHGNPFSTIPSSQTWKSCRRLDVFLSHSSDCKNICEVVREYLHNDINNALREYGLNISPIMYENWPPSLKGGNATESSLNGVEFSSVVFAFIYKKHGKIRNEEIFYAIKLCKEKKIQDVHVFFQKIPAYHLIREDIKVKELRQKLGKDLTYYPFKTDSDVIKIVSQIVIKAVCELKKSEGTSMPEEKLESSGGGTL